MKIKPTKEQKEVISATEGVILVNAVAGSGKTSTLAERTKKLSPDSSKLIMAFNKKAVEQFDDKIKGIENCKTMTFHSFCVRELMSNHRTYGYIKKPALLNRGLFSLIKEAISQSDDNEIKSFDKEIVKYCEHSMYTIQIQNQIIILKKELEDMKDKILKMSQNVFDEEEFDLFMNWFKEDFLSNNDEEELYDEFYVPSKDEELNLLDLELIDNIKFRYSKLMIDIKSDIQQEVIEFLHKQSEYFSYRAVIIFREWLRKTLSFTFDTAIRLVAQQRHKLMYKVDHIMIDEFQDVNVFQYDIISALTKNSGATSVVCVGDPLQRIYGWRGAVKDAFGDMISEHGAKVMRLTYNFRSYDEILELANEVTGLNMKGVKGSGGDLTIEVRDYDCKELEGFVDPLDRRFDDKAILSRANVNLLSWFILLARRDIPVYFEGKGSFWDEEHIKMADEAWRNDIPWEKFQELPAWISFCNKKENVKDPERLNDLIEDVKFILSLNRSERDLLKNNIQNKEGVRLATLHKTKGMEFKKVLITGVSDRLKSDINLYYVGITRAKEKLILA